MPKPPASQTTDPLSVHSHIFSAVRVYNLIYNSTGFSGDKPSSESGLSMKNLPPN